MTDQDLQLKRLIAAAIDVGIYVALVCCVYGASTVIAILTRSLGAYFIGGIVQFLGAIAALGYMLGRDTLGGGRSLGKKLQEIRVVTASGAPVGFLESAKRNVMFALSPALWVLGTAFGLIPCVGGAMHCLLVIPNLLAWLLGVAAVIVEIVKITQDPQGVRFGDDVAGTRVIR